MMKKIVTANTKQQDPTAQSQNNAKHKEGRRRVDQTPHHKSPRHKSPKKIIYRMKQTTRGTLGKIPVNSVEVARAINATKNPKEIKMNPEA